MDASTIAEIFIEKDSIRVELEIGVSDLNGFRNIMPDGLYEQLGYDPVPLSERIPRFFAEDWVIRVDGGDPLDGRIVRLEPGRRIKRDEITGEPLPVQPEDNIRPRFHSAHRSTRRQACAGSSTIRRRQHRLCSLPIL